MPSDSITHNYNEICVYTWAYRGIRLQSKRALFVAWRVNREAYFIVCLQLRKGKRLINFDDNNNNRMTLMFFLNLMKTGLQFK